MVLGYGGFRQIFSPDYYPSVIAWLEDGGIYVEPSLRGGGEYGEEWHRAGMLTRKQNTFDDFIAAAEELVRLGWTRPELLVARGESNGGLLVTAVLTQRPELFRAVVATVPITDMLRFHLVGQGSSFVSEYGTPDSAEHFAVLRAYSPYHNVREGTKYPAVLVLMSDSDDRVDGMHARKFVAALQAATKGGPVLLRVRKNAGHEGSSSTAAMVNEEVDVHSFVSASLRP